MTLSLEERLNQILPRITSRDFLVSKGLGNEIGFWVFDYPPERELDVRNFVAGTVLPALAKQSPPIQVATVNLLQLVTDLLEERKLLDKTLDMQKTKGACEDYRINIEGFAKLVNDYLATQPAHHKVIFPVDEVGQFIGTSSPLMLNLQTITEELGAKCKGRAWVIVTSQEDIDAAIGEDNKAKSQDFSKIQGRFHTGLSLASSNADEVIGVRLLAKTEAAQAALKGVFASRSDVINNQLSFVGKVLRQHTANAQDQVIRNSR